MKPRCDLVGVEKKPRPSGRRAGLTIPVGAWFQKERPRRSAGPSVRVISLRKEGYFAFRSWTIRQFGARGPGSSGSERLLPKCCRGATGIRSQWRFIGEHWIVDTSRLRPAPARIDGEKPLQNKENDRSVR
jgi:hypothetical protein